MQLPKYHHRVLDYNRHMFDEPFKVVEGPSKCLCTWRHILPKAPSTYFYTYCLCPYLQRTLQLILYVPKTYPFFVEIKSTKAQNTWVPKDSVPYIIQSRLEAMDNIGSFTSNTRDLLWFMGTEQSIRHSLEQSWLHFVRHYKTLMVHVSFLNPAQRITY